MNPPTKGPSTGPAKGAIANNIIGACISFGKNKSDTLPPATLMKALPDNPEKKRAMSMVWMFCATAHGMVHIRKKSIERRYIGRRP